ncbi:WxL domain-containing protein [Latilactobacillus sakei]|uniref:WxL domain-containing protein n=1 Tax=Latilactobacillus sakei TaxID=1599 RepID=UPI003F52CD84
MKTKRFIYLGLAILLSSASLTNLPTRVSAAESSSSSVSSSQSSDTKESTTATSESSQSKSSQSVMLSSGSSVGQPTEAQQKAAVKSISTQSGGVSGDSHGIPAMDDGRNVVSKNGWSFLLTIFRNGFNSQPEPEQYIEKAKVATTKFTDLKLLNPKNSFFTAKVNVVRWHWDSTAQKWVNDAINTTVNAGYDGLWGLIGFYAMKDYPLGNLDVGDYYYQFSFVDSSWGAKTFYSQLAKVVVVPTAQPATAIDADTDNTDGTPKVLYSDVSYAARAIMNPTNSTDVPSWAVSDANGGPLKFTPANGRVTTIMPGNGKATSDSYIPDNFYVNKVNKDPKVPGIPAKYLIKANANVMKTKEVYVGGLPAFNGAADGGGVWKVGGLPDLKNAVGSMKPWSYSWKFMTTDGKDVTPATGSGVNNISGSVANLMELNTRAALSFDKDSAFMKDAAVATASGKSYQAQLTLSTTIEPESDSSKATAQTVTVISNKAELQATPATGKLSLDAVPSFDFGSIPVSQFYNGNTAANAPTATGDLTVSDTRAGNKDWKLQASATNFVSADQTLKPVTFQLLNILGATDSKDLTTGTTNLTTISDNTTGTVGTSKVSAKMLITGNPTIQMKNNESFANLITWTLSSTQPTALAAK